MIIGIDGNEANINQRVGVGRYAFELLQELSKLRMENGEFRIYLKDNPLPEMPPAGKNWQYRMAGPKRFWTQFGLPLALAKEPMSSAPAVFFTPGHYAPRFCRCPRVIAIMDLAFFNFPEMFKKNDLWQLKNWTAYSVKKAAKIFTISRSTKNDIIKYYRVPEEKVVVTYPGYEMEKFKVQSSKFKVIRQKYGLAGKYILAVGTLQPRKNYVRLIEVFSLLGWSDWQLAIVGKKGWLWEEILAAPQKFGVAKQVKFLDFVPDADLPALYKGASCFAMVSLYEGFGIPILEAMNFGCPVVAANISSLPELVGQAGILVDPYDARDIARGIKETVATATELAKKGLVQCRQFSWEKCARETLKVLEEVASAKP